jgi:cell division protein FtsQ
LGKTKPRKNRYKKKKPVKNRAETLRQGVRILLKSAFLALVMVGMSLVFIFVHDVLTQCDYFKAEKIAVEGERILTREEILKTAEIEKGDNLVAMNLRTIQRKLRSHPWIADADVRRTFPDRIHIRIREQEPLAVLDFGKPFLVNTSGVIFKEAQAAETSGLPVMKGLTYADWKPAENPDTETPVFDSVMDILRISRRSGETPPVTEIKTIHVDREMGLRLEIAGPVRFVQFGYGGYDKKYGRLSKVLCHIAENEALDTIQAIDLRNPEHIVATPGTKILSEKNKKEV